MLKVIQLYKLLKILFFLCFICLGKTNKKKSWGRKLPHDFFLFVFPSEFFLLFNNISVMPTFVLTAIIIIPQVFLYLFDGVSTPHGLFNDKIGLISKCLITIITIFSMFHYSFFLNCSFIICLSFVCSVIWYQVFLFSTNN